MCWPIFLANIFGRRTESAQLRRNSQSKQRNDSFFSLSDKIAFLHISQLHSLALARASTNERAKRECVCVSSRPVCTISFIFAGRPTSKKSFVCASCSICAIFCCCSAFNFAAKTNHGILFFEQCIVYQSQDIFLFSFLAIFCLPFKCSFISIFVCGSGGNSWMCVCDWR